MITVVPRPNNFLHASFEVPNKDSLESRMANYGIYTCCASRDKSYRGRVKGDFIYLYTAQKLRRKTKTTYKFSTSKPKKRNGANNHNFVTEVIRHAHWEVRVYKFPLDRVISAKQETRTFKISISG
jgi:hypothetical protein